MGPPLLHALGQCFPLLVLWAPVLHCPACFPHCSAYAHLIHQKALQKPDNDIIKGRSVWAKLD